MTACRADWRRIRYNAAIGGFVVCFAATAAEAQVGPPIRLTPPPRGEAPPGPPQSVPERSRTGTIEIERARPIEFDTIGLIDSARGGLPADIWTRSDGATVDRLLAALPAGFTAAATRNLARRLLATAAAAPPRAGAAASEGERAGFAGRRAERLMAMGDVAGAIDLAKALPARIADEGAARVQLDGLWLGGDNDAACAFARGQGARHVSADWLKAGTFCQMLAGERGRAQLGLNLLREQGQEDPTFVRLALAVGSNAPVSTGGVKEPSPLMLAMLRATRQPLTGEFARTAPPAMLPTIAASPDTPIDIRLVAAERALAYGALPAERLAALYDSLDLKPDQAANAAAFAEKDKGPRGRAALYRAAKEQAPPIARAETLRRLWSQPDNAELRAAMLQLAVPLVRTLNPSPELAWFAGDATRAMLAAGDLDGARVWATSIQAAGAADDDAARLWAVLRLAGGDALAPWEPARLDAWRQANDRASRDGAASRRDVLAVLFSALGELAAPQLVPEFGAEGPMSRKAEMPHPALWLALMAGHAERRVGEAVLSALIVLGPDGAAGGNAYAMGAAVAALRGAGLEPDARAIAVGAAIAAGL